MLIRVAFAFMNFRDIKIPEISVLVVETNFDWSRPLISSGFNLFHWLSESGDQQFFHRIEFMLRKCRIPLNWVAKVLKYFIL